MCVWCTYIICRKVSSLKSIHHGEKMYERNVFKLKIKVKYLMSANIFLVLKKFTKSKGT